MKRLLAIVVMLTFGTPVAAHTLEARLIAAETRMASLRAGLGGTGAEVRLVGTQPIIVRAAEGATAADMAWANHVVLASELALALGVKSVEHVLITQSFDQMRSISVEGGLPIAGHDPGQVVAQFFKALIQGSDEVSLDIYVAVVDAPSDWSAMLDAIREVSVSTPSLVAGTESRISFPIALEGDPVIASAQSPHAGISADFPAFLAGEMSVTITADLTVPKGLYPVYFYSQDSKFEPAARINLRIKPPSP